MSVPPSAKLTTLRDGRYTLLRSIGAGSQAETYEARDNGIVREHPGQLIEEWQRYVTRARRGDAPAAQGLVAIKCFHVGRAKAWKDVELAEREARTLASLARRCVCPLTRSAIAKRTSCSRATSRSDTPATTRAS